FDPVVGCPLPGAWTRQQLIKHTKTAMAVELSTLPIYFCALYSINQDTYGWGSRARSHWILSVAEQEMLHLALAGNMLVALGGEQRLYDKSFMPTYPDTILFDKIPMELRPANKENLEWFIKIEAPYQAPPKPPGDGMRLAQTLPEYNSIGEFYKGLQKGGHGNLFATEGTDRQLKGAEFFYSAMTVVIDKASALEVLNTIVDQGVGGIGVPESHYTVFVELYQQRTRWKCVDYIKEPHTADYKGKNNLSRAVDAAYFYLLQTLDRCWYGDLETVASAAGGPTRTQLLRNVRRLMVAVLSPIARVLIKQPVGNPGQFAAPCFEFYGKDDSDTTYDPKDLFACSKKEIELA
ncbi:ferritin-like-domain-containing protein, partial [Trametes meyenii]